MWSTEADRMVSKGSIFFVLLMIAFVSVTLCKTARTPRKDHNTEKHANRYRRKTRYYALSDEIQRAVKGILTTSRHSIDRRPMEGVDLTCNNKAATMIIAQYRTKATVRWKHNGQNLKIEPSRMQYSIDSLAINDLLPRDSGVYHCQIKLSPHQLIVVAVFSLVVGEHLKQVSVGGELHMQCNSGELGHIFHKAERTWIDPHEKAIITKPAADTGDDVIPDVIPSFAGNWTCKVLDPETQRTWTTSRYGIIIAPSLSLTMRLRQVISQNKVNTLLVCVAVGFLFLITINSIVDTFGKKAAKRKEEMEFLRAALEAEEPQLDDVTFPLLVTST